MILKGPLQTKPFYDAMIVGVSAAGQGVGLPWPLWVSSNFEYSMILWFYKLQISLLKQKLWQQRSHYSSICTNQPFFPCRADEQELFKKLSSCQLYAYLERQNQHDTSWYRSEPVQGWSSCLQCLEINQEPTAQLCWSHTCLCGHITCHCRALSLSVLFGDFMQYITHLLPKSTPDWSTNNKETSGGNFRQNTWNIINLNRKKKS